MQRTMHLTLGVLDGIAQRARMFAGAPRTRTVQGQADEAAIVEGLVTLGLVQRGCQSQACYLRVHPFGAVRQGVITEACFETQLGAYRRARQPFQAQETGGAQNAADDDGPDQIPRRNVRMGSAVTRCLQVQLQSETVLALSTRAGPSSD